MSSRRKPSPRPSARSTCHCRAITVKTCATSPSSPSTLPMRATMTTRSGPNPTGRAATARSSRSLMSAITSAPAAISTAKRASAAIRSISPTASCRCCPKCSAPMSAASSRMSTGRRWPVTSASTRMARSATGALPAPSCAWRRTSPMKTRRRRSMPATRPNTSRTCGARGSCCSRHGRPATRSISNCPNGRSASTTRA